MESFLSFQLIEAKNYGSMPWKNGLGVTRQIDIHPPEASFPSDKFNWRLSSATITSSNSFSLFPGYDRILVVWTGSGLVLNRDRKLLPLQPYTFPGEDQIECQLIDSDSQVVDYGIIFNRDTVKASMTISTGENVNLGLGTHYLTVISGHFSLSQPHLTVQTGDTLVVHNNSHSESRIQLIASASGTEYFHTHLKLTPDSHF